MSDHIVYFGDCLDPVTGLARLPDKSVDHVICDPPYEAEAHTLQRVTPRGPGNGRSVPEAKPIPFAPITQAAREESAAEMARVTRRWVLVFCQVEAVAAWRLAIESAGFRYRRTCVWVKPDAQPQLSGNMPAMGYETFIAAHAPGHCRWNGGGKSGVYTVNRKHPASRADVHPTAKPLDLMESMVRDFTDAGETVLDPFAGSGTTGVACKRLGRRFVGWEKDPKYHAIAAKRIEAAREQLGLFKGPKPPKVKQTALELGEGT